MTDADKIMHPQHFGADPTDMRIQIWINLKIRIRIPDHFWLKFWRWRRFAPSECSCSEMFSRWCHVTAIHCSVFLHFKLNVLLASYLELE